MKTLKSKLLVALIFLISSTNVAFSQIDKEEFIREYNKSYVVNPDALLIVKNKFGKIHINNWEKNEIMINVKIIVKVPNENIAEKVFNKINIVFEGSETQVCARTEIISPINFKNLDIDYTINAPATIALDLKNKFGSVFINNHTGKTLIKVDYGKLQANKLLNKENEIHFGYGEGKIHYITEGTLFVNFSSLDVDEGKKLQLITRCSKITIDAAQLLACDSQYDKYVVGKVFAMGNNSSFSDFKINYLVNTLKSDMQYGGYSIKNVSPNFKEINIDHQFAYTKIYFDPDASYELDVDMQFGDLEYMQEKARILEKDSSGPGPNIELKAIIGNQPTPSSKVIIDSQFGDVILKETIPSQ